MVEWDGLENRCTGNRTVGSNPTLSAIAIPVRKHEQREGVPYGVDGDRICEAMVLAAVGLGLDAEKVLTAIAKRLKPIAPI